MRKVKKGQKLAVLVLAGDQYLEGERKNLQCYNCIWSASFHVYVNTLASIHANYK